MKSLEGQFLDFCRSKPADEAYDYCDSTVCALAQFASFAGIRELVGAGGTSWLNEHPRLHEAVCPMEGEGEWTFGALTARLEAASTPASVR